MITAHGYAAYGAGEPLAPWTFQRRSPGPADIQIDILYTGICHTDIHQTTDHWGGSTFPMVPGHEIVGRVAAVGAQVKKFRVGDYAAVGCLVDSDRTCSLCQRDLEQYCPEVVYTYNAHERGTGQITYGGYSDVFVVDQHFAVKVPDNADLAGTAPLLCAGITMYAPLRRWNVGPGHRIGIVGLGGLGHIGVKLAKAVGADVSVITTSPSKVDDARRLGAHHVVISRDDTAMTAAARTYDLILDTIPSGHDVNPFLSLLKNEATLVLVGALELIEPVDGSSLIYHGRTLAGTGIGGMAQTQEMIDFCAEHHIVSDIEMVSIQDVNSAYERLARNDVKYRFVIDMSTLESRP